MNTHCRSCKKPIVWAETEKGRKMPVDLDATPDGNIELRDRGRNRAPLAIYVKASDDGELRFTSHFVTCPQANRWRKPS